MNPDTQGTTNKINFQNNIKIHNPPKVQITYSKNNLNHKNTTTKIIFLINK